MSETRPKFEVEEYQPAVTVQVDTRLLPQLSEWSVPVQVRVVRRENGYDMEVRQWEPVPPRIILPGADDAPYGLKTDGTL